MPRRLTLFSLVLATLPAAAPATADAPGNPGTVQFKGASFPIEESAGEVVVIVRRHGGSTGEVSVDFETFDGSALAGEDYTAATGTLVWGDGDGEDKTIPIEILVDGLGEPQETFSVMLANPVGGVAIGAVATTVVRIKPHDGDGGGGGGGGGSGESTQCLKLRSSTFPAFESAGEATFVVEREGDGAGEASVDYLTIDGSAVAGEDYTPVAGTLTWPDGVAGEMSVAVPLVDDDVAEGDETISVVITNAVGGALGCQDTASIVVVDDDGGGEGACVPDEETLCLGASRFALRGTWTDFQGGQGAFRAVPSTEQAGLFWFFDARNIEVMVKVLDGCALNDHRWVFLAATTNVGYTLEVTDLATGAVRTYTNPLGTRAPATTDVDAFPCTP